MNRRSAIILSLFSVLFYAWPMLKCFYSPGPGPAAFAVHAPPPPSRVSAPLMVEEFISPDPGEGMVHVGSICELENGSLLAAWYGGTREGAGDVAIFTTTKDRKPSAGWTAPKRVVDRVSASRELRRYIKKVGNPVVFTGFGNRVWLIYVTISAGGWSGSSLNVKVSYDSGSTWTPGRRLTLSPFFNISELVKNRPQPLEGGEFALPIYHECLGNFSEILWMRPGSEQGRIFYRKSRMTWGRTFIQPSVVALDPRHATAYYRCRTKKKAIGWASTRNGGRTWSEPETLSLPNPDSAVDAVLLSGNRTLLVFNDSEAGRQSLCLAVSGDRGPGWIRAATLENTLGEEFSYPFMIRTRDGLIHLVYTWKRKRIKHVVFNEAWIDEQIKGAGGQW